MVELIDEKLDADVTKWLKDHTPAPKYGQNYHQWLSGQFGLKKTCRAHMDDYRHGSNMHELRDHVNEMYGKQPVQLRTYRPRPGLE